MKNLLILSAIIFFIYFFYSSSSSSTISQPQKTNYQDEETASEDLSPEQTSSDEYVDTNDGSPDYYQDNSFHGYQCTDDCSGHEAGYSWAEENGIDDVDNCDGNSESFNEGCTAYVEENYENVDVYDSY